MRVITGAARGFNLETMPGDETRPTSDRVKHGLFNILQFDIAGRTVLDLFAGSGQLGIEALSRGAVKCVFVEKNKAAAEVIQRNITALSQRAPEAFRDAKLEVRDAAQYLSATGERFDIALLDPPYADGISQELLNAVAAVMRDGGVIVCETDGKISPPPGAGGFSVVRDYRYGRAALWVYRKTEGVL